MGEYVRVESIVALRRFRTALCRFAEAVGLALDEAEAELLRTDLWLKQEQPAHWKRQLALRTELHTRAKSELTRKKYQKTALGLRPSCVDEEKALVLAEQHLAEARAKQAALKAWSRTFERETYAYMAVSQDLRVAVQNGIPRGLAQLDAMVAALEAYAVSPEQKHQASASTTTPAAGPADPTQAGSPFARPVSVETPATGESGDWACLRALTPVQAERDALSICAPPSKGTPAAPLGADGPAGAVPGAGAEVAPRLADFGPQLAALRLARTPAAPDDKVVLARGVWEHERVVLERIPPVPGDSGWYIGPADPDAAAAVAECISMRAGDVLAERPALAALLELPPGCLLVLNGLEIAAVIDAGDVVRWPASDAAPPIDGPSNREPPNGESE
ncbi:MAG: hypothetical protein AB1716_05465 [Planctomycetota bacterium]